MSEHKFLQDMVKAHHIEFIKETADLAWRMKIAGVPSIMIGSLKKGRIYYERDGKKTNRPACFLGPE